MFFVQKVMNEMFEYIEVMPYFSILYEDLQCNITYLELNFGLENQPDMLLLL